MICIVGADGFFGSYLQKHILSQDSHPFLLCLNHSDTVFPEADNKKDMGFELWDNDSIKRAAEFISGYSDIRIIFLASVHNPDAIKKDPLKAEYINTVCYRNFLEEIKGADVKKLIYSSSDTVYGESKDGYVFSEKDQPDPINIYGEQKLLAEKITTEYGFCNARYSYMCAPSIINRKKHFLDDVINTLNRDEQIFMLTDWIRSSLSYTTAAELTYKLLKSDFNESFINICADKPISKYDIGLNVSQYCGKPSSLVVPCTMKELGIFTEKRANEILTDNTKLKNILNIDRIEFNI